MEILDLLYATFSKNASDLIIKAGSSPLVRIQGELIPLAYPPLTKEQTNELAFSLLSRKQLEKFEKDLEIDLSTSISNLARFRVNLYHQQGSVAIVARLVPTKTPTLDELGLPLSAKALALKSRGLVLITGPAGSGKTTTLASMIEFRNENSACHIVTIEDPIEFVYECKKALIDQREVGRDTVSFTNALKSVLRQDPDVIMIGEMRDAETISLALTAAETGHLVFSTLHTPSSAETIERIVGTFPSHQENQVRLQLSVNLAGIISQILCKKNDGKGRIPAFEILLANYAVRTLIREGKISQLSSVLQTGSKLGMITLNLSLAELVKKELITKEEAFSHTDNIEELKSLITK